MENPTIFDLITPTQFSYDTLTDIRDTRFTVLDLMPLFGTSRTHAAVVSAVETEWAATPERMPPLIEVTRYRNKAAFAVQTRVLTHNQVMRLMARMTSDVGRNARDKVELYMDALEALALEKHAAAEKGKVDLLIAASLITSSQLTKMAMRGHLKKQSKADIVDFALAEEQAWRERYAAAGVSPPSSGEEYEALYAVIKHEAGERTRALEDAKKRTAALPTTKEIRK